MLKRQKRPKQECIVLRFNHFDPLWRRCWDRPFQDAGRRFASYRAIEQACIEDAIKSSRDGVSCYTVEATWVLRHYLERHPEHLRVIRSLIRQGRFELMGSGENIIDGNMVHGELLARNLVLGTLWAENVLGCRPTTGCHGDGFGSSAQMPQIFRQCGYDWVPGISYNVPDAPYWRGLDGSVILFEVRGRLVYRWSTRGCAFVKLPPCPACRGKGCTTCHGRGFEEVRADLDPPAERLAGEVGVLWVGGEEVLPSSRVAADVARLNVERKDVVFRQGTYRTLRDFLKNELARVDNPPPDQISSKVENNPSTSGGYVTRIKIKQGHRAAEHALLAAEAWDTILAHGAGADRLRDGWKQMSLSGFHDSLPCSHIDQAYDELLDLQKAVLDTAGEIAAKACRRITRPSRTPGGQAFTVFNSESGSLTAPVTVTVPGTWPGAAATVDGERLPVYEVQPAGRCTAVTLLAKDIPALGARTLVLSRAPARVRKISGQDVACGPFTVSLGKNGVTGLAVAGIGPIAGARRFLVGELVLEHDFGDPWATRSLDRARERLSPHTRIESVERRGDSLVITCAGRHPSCDNGGTCEDPMVTWLTWRQVFHLRESLPWIEVDTAVDWYTHNRRLRLMFPSTTELNRGVYSIPYGVLERDRYEGTTNYGNSAGGDWPAIHWAGIQAPGHTLAVFNRGTPSYRVEDGVVTVSVLRSPQLPHALLEPASYVAYNYGGMADHGRHLFRHAICAVKGHWRDNDVSRQAAAFNSHLVTVPGTLARPLPAWGLKAAHTMLTVVKTAEDGNGVVVRLVEMSGHSETAYLEAPPEFVAASETNLLEDAQRPIRRTPRGFPVALQPWKIVTLKLTRGGRQERLS